MNNMYFDYANLIPELKNWVAHVKDNSVERNLEIWQSITPFLASLCDDYQKKACIKGEDNELLKAVYKCSTSMGSPDSLIYLINTELIPGIYNYFSIIEKIEVETSLIDIQVISSKSGLFTLYNKKNNLYLLDESDPLSKCRDIAGNIYSNECSRYSLLHCELGYLAYSLWEISRGDIKLTIYESCEEQIELAYEWGVLGFIPEECIEIVRCIDDADAYQKYSDSQVSTANIPGETNRFYMPRTYMSSFSASCKNVGILIDDSDMTFGDCHNPRRGNPGIGGSEYEALLLAGELARLCEDICVSVYHTNDRNLMPDGTRGIVVNSTASGVRLCKSENEDVLIFLFGPDNALLNAINLCKMKSIAILNNYLEYYGKERVEFLKESSYIKKLVCVSEAMYHIYDSDPIKEKMTWINNMWAENEKDELMTGSKKTVDNHNVTFVGGLYPNKGVHILTSVWKRVIDKVPDAKLHIIGSGRLYLRSLPLGKYGLASEEYERQLLQGITNENGEIIPSVIFHGLMGIEKNEIIAQSRVGVVNPSGATETFCISAVEFEAKGVPVITKDVPGIHTTMENGTTGILINNENELVDAIVDLLLNDELHKSISNQAKKYAYENFSPNHIIPKWYKLIITV